jgi:hypothetical protein
MSLQFVSWSRRGVGAGTTAGQVGSRRLVTTSVTVTANRQGQATPTEVRVDSAPMAVLGPGDVEGVAVEQIVRRSPRPDSHNLEPNYLAVIEFAHPDLPWIFSPAQAAQGRDERLDPWLMLAVVDRSQMQVTVRPGSPNPALRLSDPAAVPAPADAWAFAHVQVHGTDADGATEVLRGDQPVAANIRSRLVCPTRLAPDHDYVAVLLPTYEAGRRVGLGLEEGDAGTAFWTAAGGLVLPVYDSWRFRTGPAGDFETLARKLHGITGPSLEHLGERLVTVESRAALMQRDAPPDLFPSVVHRVPTAIAKDDVAGPLSAGAPAEPQADALHRRLKELLDIVAGATEESPVVGPPLYGQWPACVTSLDGAPDQPTLRELPADEDEPQTWVQQLNADPYLRMAAALGTRVVQQDQEPLMTDAWSQLSSVLAANARMRWSRLFSEASLVVHDRLDAATAASALRVTAPAFARVLEAPGTTVRAAVDATTLPREVLGSTFAKVAQYAVRADLRTDAPTSLLTAVGTAVEAIRTSETAVLPARFTTPRSIDPGVLGQVLDTGDLAARVREGSGTEPGEYLERIREVPTEVTRIATRFEDLEPAPGPQEIGRGPVHVFITKRKAAQLGDVVEGLPAAARTHHFGAEVTDEIAGLHHAEKPMVSMQTIAAMNALAVTDDAAASGARIDLGASGVQIGISDRLDATLGVLTTAIGVTAERAQVFSAGDALRTAALTNLDISAPSLEDVIGQVDEQDSALLGRVVDGVAADRTPPDARIVPPPLETFDLATRQTMVDALEPRAAYGRMLQYAHRDFSSLVVRRPMSPFHPAMASPRFPQPQVDRLRALDEDWVLGGVRDLPPNSICLLAVNWRFVEAFLAGANHEMARELLWRGYPTDLRGTCFASFWGASDPDIATMDTWRGDFPDHGPTGQRHELTMVVIKGDLLRRYPSTLVSAEHGTASADKDDPQFTSDDEIAQEVFRGFLGEDVTYVALDIPIDRLRSEVDPANRRHCWYVSLLEPHDEPRFGLDESTDPQPPRNADPGGLPGRAYSVTDDWSWEGIQPAAPHLTPAAVFADDSSAVVGASLFQRPFRLLLRAPDYLPTE